MAAGVYNAYDRATGKYVSVDKAGYNAMANGASYASLASSSQLNTPSATYVATPSGNVVSQYTKGNQTYGVAKNSIFDPLSSNYNPVVANSGGKITLSNYISGNYPGGSNYTGASGNPVAGASGNPVVGGGYYTPTIGSYATSQQSLIDQMIAQQQAAQLEAIRTGRKNTVDALSLGKTDVGNNYDEATNKLNTQKSQAGGQYQALRNNASVQANQNTEKLKEIMAAQGLFNSGTNITGQLQVDTNRQNAMNTINTDEQNYNQNVGDQLTALAREKASQIAKIDQQIAAANSSSSASELTALADLSSQKTKMTMDLQNIVNQMTQFQQQMDYQKTRDTQNDVWKQKTFDQDKANADRAYNYQTSRDAIADNQWGQEFGLKQATAKYSGSGTSSGTGYSGYGFTQGYPNSATQNYSNMLMNIGKSGGTLEDIQATIQANLASGLISPAQANYAYNEVLPNIPLDNWQVSLPQYMNYGRMATQTPQGW